MNIQQAALKHIQDNGGVIKRSELLKYLQSSMGRRSHSYPTNLYYRIVKRGFMSVEKKIINNRLNAICTITKLGQNYLNDGPFVKSGKRDIVLESPTIKKKVENKKATPVEKLIRGSIIRDLLLSKFDQLSASERCGLLEIYNTIESNAKTNQQ